MMIRCSECGEEFRESDLQYGMCAACAAPGNPDPYDGEHDCQHDWADIIARLQANLSNRNEEDRD